MRPLILVALCLASAPHVGAQDGLAPCPLPCTEALDDQAACLPPLDAPVPACSLVAEVYAAAAAGDRAALLARLDDHVMCADHGVRRVGRSGVADRLLRLAPPVRLRTDGTGRVVATEAPPNGPRVVATWTVIGGVVTAVERAAMATARAD